MEFADVLLGKAVSLMLFGWGFTESDSTEAPLITDIADQVGRGKTLFIGCEPPETKVRYLHRPFEESALREAAEELVSGTEKVSRSELRIDRKRNVAYLDGVKVALTERETSLLSLLAQNKGKAVSDEEILEKVFEGEAKENSNVAAVYVNYLRKKLEAVSEKKMIHRLRGRGYMLK